MDHVDAVLSLWPARAAAEQRAHGQGKGDGSLFDGVRAGTHLDPIVAYVGEVFVRAGLPPEAVHVKKSMVVVPGFYRATKQWDILVVHEHEVVAAIEFKSMIGSVGKNLNNRMEESIGSAVDFQQSAEAGLLGDSPPWLGYVYIIEDLDAAKTRVGAAEPHFPVDPVFNNASYEDRMEIYLRRLVMKRVYDAAWLAVGNPVTGVVREPCAELTWLKFEAAIRGRVGEILA